MRLRISPPEILAVINVSPESFYQGSVRLSEDSLLNFVHKSIKLGVRFFDIGGMSTAPYRKTWVPEDIEVERLKWAVSVLRREFGDSIFISIDTFRPRVADEVAKLGVDIINDVTGLKYSNGELAKVAKEHGAAMILCAREKAQSSLDPVEAVIGELSKSMQLASSIGVDEVIIDPCIGFPPLDRDPSVNPGEALEKTRYDDWPYRDVYILANIAKIKDALKKPLCVGVSRKGFIRVLLNRNIDESLWGTLGLHAYLAYMGVDLIRAHDVEETVDVVKIVNIVKVCVGKSYAECLVSLSKAYKGLGNSPK